MGGHGGGRDDLPHALQPQSMHRPVSENIDVLIEDQLELGTSGCWHRRKLLRR